MDMTNLSFDDKQAEELKNIISKTIKPDARLNTLPALNATKKKALLVVPPGTIDESYGRLSAAAGELPMMGLAYIAASLCDQGNDVRIIDCEVNHWPMAKVAEVVAEFRPDILGMTAYITNMRRCAKVAETAKSVDPGVTVILGGPQVTIFPEEAFESPYVDMIVRSEGEIIIRNVVNALGDEAKLSEVKGIWFRRSDGTLARNPSEGLVEDLDIFPPPALHLFEMEKYFPPANIRGARVAHLLTSRGCPFKCTFCETKLTFGRSFRYHSTARVVEDLRRLIGMGYDSFQFYDDIFTINKNRVSELCDAIIDNGWKIKWMCFTRTNCLSPDMLKRMKDAGCYLISFGCETGNDDLLKIIRKDLTVAKNREGIAMTKRAGIKTLSTFMLGLPGETPEHTERTIRFALDSGLDYALFPITEPYPGTELWVDAQKYGAFDTSGRYSNNLLSESSAVWVPTGRTRDELEKLSISAMKRFYLRPRILWGAIVNFLHLPTGRAIRFLWSGVKLFVIESRRKSKAGARY